MGEGVEAFEVRLSMSPSLFVFVNMHHKRMYRNVEYRCRTFCYKPHIDTYIHGRYDSWYYLSSLSRLVRRKLTGIQLYCGGGVVIVF